MDREKNALENVLSVYERLEYGYTGVSTLRGKELRQRLFSVLALEHKVKTVRTFRTT